MMGVDKLRDVIRLGTTRGLDFVILEEPRKRTGIVSREVLKFALAEMLYNALDKADFIDHTVLGVRDPLEDAEKFDSPIAPNREKRCRRPQNVVLTREETLKLVNSQGVAWSETLESSSCFSRCLRRQVTGKGILERFSRSLEVF